MATFVVLANFTEQGVRAVKETTRRADAFREQAKKFGVTVKEMYWTLGKHDIVTILEAPDAASVTALSLALSALGNVRTQTLPAYNAAEMGGILSKLGS
jgi:uncharacterized protein with GYD domain